MKNCEINDILIFTKNLYFENLIYLLKNTERTKLSVFGEINSVNLLMIICPQLYTDIVIIRNILDEIYYEFIDINIIFTQASMKMFYCSQLLQKCSDVLLIDSDCFLLFKTYDYLEKYENLNYDDFVLSLMFFLNKWYKRCLLLYKSQNDLQCFWNKQEFLKKLFLENRYLKSIDLIKRSLKQKTTRLMLHVTIETFETLLLLMDNLEKNKRDLLYSELMILFIDVLNLSNKGQKTSFQAFNQNHNLLKVLIQKSKNTSLLLELVPNLKENVLFFLKNEKSFNKYSILYSIMIEYDYNINYDKNWMFGWLKPALDIFIDLPSGIKYLFVGQFIPKIYKSICLVMLKSFSKFQLFSYLFELATIFKCFPAFIILNKFNSDDFILNHSFDFDFDNLFDIVIMVIRQNDGIIAIEAMKFYIKLKNSTIENQCILISKLIYYHSNDESAVVRKMFEGEFKMYLKSIRQFENGLVYIIDTCLEMLTPTTTFGQNTIVVTTLFEILKRFEYLINDDEIAFKVCKKICTKVVLDSLIYLLMDSFNVNKDQIFELISVILKLFPKLSIIFTFEEINGFVSLIFNFPEIKLKELNQSNLSSKINLEGLILNKTLKSSTTDFFSGYLLSILGLLPYEQIKDAFLIYFEKNSQIDQNFVSSYDYLMSLISYIIKQCLTNSELKLNKNQSILVLVLVRKFLSFPIYMFRYESHDQIKFLLHKHGPELLKNLDNLLSFSSMIATRVIENDIKKLAEDEVILWWKITRECCVLLSLIVELIIQYDQLDLLIFLNSQFVCDSKFKQIQYETTLFRISSHYLNIFINSTHVGLYNVAYESFVKILSSLWKQERFYHLPQQYLDQILELIIQDNKNNNNNGEIFSIPRRKRSAGIPLFFQVIIKKINKKVKSQ